MANMQDLNPNQLLEKTSNMEENGKIGNEVGVKGDSSNFLINRRIFTKSNFDLISQFDRSSTSLKNKFSLICNSCCPRDSKKWKKRILKFFPFLGILRAYSKKDLVSDSISGLTVGVMHIPQGMAYGTLANLDPVYGLYSSFFPIFIYFFFGTSRHISLGVFAVISLMLGSIVDNADCSQFGIKSPFDNSSSPSNDSSQTKLIADCKLSYAVTVTFLVGLIQLLMGIFQFGFLTVYLSNPLTRGLTTGAGVHVFSSQIKHVLGIKLKKFNGPLKLLYLYKNIIEEIPKTNWAPVVTCIICIIFIYSVQKWLNPRVKKLIKIPIPAELLVLIIGTALSHFLKFSESVNMKVVGSIPQGIPYPKIPTFFLLPQVFLDSLAIAIVSFTINISMAKMFLAKHSYEIDSTQELMAYGLTNTACSFMNCYVNAASLSRSLVQESTGGKTQVAGLVSSLLLLIVLLFVGPLFYNLPNAVLAGVIIINLRGIFWQVSDLAYLSKISTADLLTWLVTCISVVLTDVDVGLLLGIIFSFITVIYRNQKPKVTELGQVANTEVYLDIKRHKNARRLKNICIFSINSPLFYANSENFQNFLLKTFQSLPLSRGPSQATSDNYKGLDSIITEGPSSFYFVIDCSHMFFIDSVGIDTLNAIQKKLGENGVKIILSKCNEIVYKNLKKCMTLETLSPLPLFLTTHDAVLFIQNLKT